MHLPPLKKIRKNSNLPTKATTNHNDDNGDVSDAFPIGSTIQINVRIDQIGANKTKSAAVALTSCEKNSKKKIRICQQKQQSTTMATMATLETTIRMISTIRINVKAVRIVPNRHNKVVVVVVVWGDLPCAKKAQKNSEKS